MGRDGADSINGIGGLHVVPVQADDAEAILEVGGELDLSTVHVFLDAIDDVMDAGPATVVLDLAKLTFIDSSGVGAYVTAFRRAKAQGTRLRIGDRSPLIDRVLQIAGVEEALLAEWSEPS